MSSPASFPLIIVKPTALRQLPNTVPRDLVRPLVSNAGYMMDVGLQRLYSSNLSVEAVFGRL